MRLILPNFIEWYKFIRVPILVKYLICRPELWIFICWYIFHSEFHFRMKLILSLSIICVEKWNHTNLKFLKIWMKSSNLINTGKCQRWCWLGMLHVSPGSLMDNSIVSFFRSKPGQCNTLWGWDHCLFARYQPQARQEKEIGYRESKNISTETQTSSVNVIKEKPYCKKYDAKFIFVSLWVIHVFCFK